MAQLEILDDDAIIMLDNELDSMKENLIQEVKKNPKLQAQLIWIATFICTLIFT